MKIIARVIPYLFDNYLLIPLSKDWINIFGKVPQFEAFIDNKKRLVLVGPPIAKKSGDDMCE